MSGLPEWANSSLYWQGWWQAYYTDLAHPVAPDIELLRLVRDEHDSWALGYRAGLSDKRRKGGPS